MYYHVSELQETRSRGFPLFSCFIQMFLPTSFVSSSRPYHTALLHFICTFGAVINASDVERTLKCAENCYSSLQGWPTLSEAAKLSSTPACQQTVWLHMAGLLLEETNLLLFTYSEQQPLPHMMPLS